MPTARPRHTCATWSGVPPRDTKAGIPKSERKVDVSLGQKKDLCASDVPFQTLAPSLTAQSDD